MNRTLLALFAGALIVLAGCGGGGGGKSSSEPSSSFSISGTVSGAVLSGVTMSLSGTSSGTATTDASGNYSFTGLVNGPYTITPSISDCTFTPTSKTVTISGANTTAVNFTAAATKAGTKLSLFTDRVKSCMPYFEGSSASTGNTNLQLWGGWDLGANGAVLGKLFNPDIGGDECIFSQIEILDSHISMVNEFSDLWITSGAYSQGNNTAIVDTTLRTVTIPFLGFDSDLLDLLQPLDRLVTLSVPDQNLTIHMAFSQNGGNQTIVEQYVIGNTESGAYLALVEGDVVRIWHASITGSKAQFRWEGNTNEKSFKISECTNAAGDNWEVMGGGSIASPASEMAFMARNDSNNSSVDEYYLTITYDSLQNGIAQTIRNAGTTTPDPSVSVLSYIIEGNDNSLGLLGIDQYPNTLEDLAWVQ